MTEHSPGRRTARLTSLLAGGALAALLAVPAVASAEDGRDYPTRGGELLLSDANAQVWSIDPTGGTLTRVGGSTGHVGNWAPDGKRFAVAGGMMAWTYAADGFGDQYVPYTSIGIGTPAFVPNGIAFSAMPGGMTIVDAESNVQQGIDAAAMGRTTSSWTGKLVWENGNGIQIREEGANRTLVAGPSEKQPSIAQNGKVVAFVSTRNDEPDIRVIDPNAGQGIPGGFGAADFSDGSYEIASSLTSDESMPAVSPDGQKVAFASDRDGGFALYVANADGTGQPVKVQGSDLPNGITGLAWRPVALAAPTVVSAPPLRTSARRPVVTFNSTTPDAECSLNNGPWEPCAGGVWTPVTDLTDDHYTLEIRSLDAEQEPGDAATVKWTVDTSAPGAPLFTTPMPDVTDDRSATIDWDGAEPDGYFECLVDGAPVAISGGGSAWDLCPKPLTLTDLTDGEHVVQVRQVDDAGNAGEPATLKWTVDSGAPAKPQITKAPSGITASATAQITFTGEQGARFECIVDQPLLPAAQTIDPWEKCSSPLDLEGLAEGEHVVLIRQFDKAGNRSQPESVKWLVDTKAPAAPTVKVAPSGVVTATDAAFELGGEESATFEYQLDGGAWVKAPASFTVSGLAAGQHTIVLRQRDAAGNPGATATVTWTVQGAPAAPTPTPAPVKPPKFTATVGDQPANGGQSGAATVAVQDNGVNVGCSMTGVALSACKVDLYADVDADGKVSASARVLVGTGYIEADDKTNKLAVRVVLNAKGRELLRRNPQGLDVQVAITGTPVSGAPIKATGLARLVAKRSTVVVAGFDTNEAKLPAAAKRQLRALAKKLAGGATVRVIGHTDASSENARYLRKLGKARARAVKAFLAAHGAKATYTLVTRGATAPRATNATQAGRALNRRVVLKIVR